MLSGCCQDAVGYDQKWKLEKLYESKGIKPKLCSYRPVGGKSTLAHLFGFFIKNGTFLTFTVETTFLTFTVKTTFLTCTVETTFFDVYCRTQKRTRLNWYMGRPG